MKIIPQPLFLICLIIFINFSTCKEIISKVIKVVKLMDVMRTELKLKLEVFESSDYGKVGSDVFQNQLFTSTGKLSISREELKGLNLQINKVQNHVQHKLYERLDSPEHLENVLRIHEFQNSINKKIGRVVALHNAYLWYSNERMKFDDIIFFNLLDNISGAAADTVESLLRSIYGDIVNDRTRAYSLLTVLASQFISEEDSVCNTQRSLQFIIFDAYAAILLLEYMGVSMRVFALKHIVSSNSVLDPYERRIPGDSITTMDDRIESYIEQFLAILEELPSNFRRCDPIPPTRDVTFYEFEGFSQGQLLMTSKEDSWLPELATCYRFGLDQSTPHDNCDDLTRRFIHPCDDETTDCSSTHERYNIELCYTPREQKQLITRQYRWFSGGENSTNDFEINTFYSCKPTEMYEPEESIPLSKTRPEKFRYGFSTSYAMSNYRRNRVIVGVRLRKRNNVIYIQIKEAELLPHGDIKTPEKDEWLPLPLENTPENTVLYLDDEHKQIELNDAIFDSNHLLVWVKFINLYNGKRLRLVALGLPFNTETGALDILSVIPEAGCGNYHDTEILMDDVDSPLATDGTPIWKSGNNSLITIQHTSWAKDGARTTIPFLDAQDLTTYPYLPLNGIGIEYKTAGKGFAGYISLKPYTINIAPTIKKLKDSVISVNNPKDS